MAVHFRFFSSKKFDSICVTGDSISLAGLKDAIADHMIPGILEGKGRVKEPFDFRVYNAETEEEIVGANAKIWKHSRVLVKRVPAFLLQQQQPRATAIKEAVQNYHRPCVEIEDDFGEVYSSPSMSSADAIATSGRSCLTEEEVESSAMLNKKVVKGIRESGIVRVRNGRDLSSKVHDTRVKPEMAQPAALFCRMEIPSELICLLCKNIMKDPVLIRCCFHSFCHNCIKVVLVEQNQCPKCESTKCTESDLFPNRHLTTMIELFQKSEVSASSSAGSNGRSSFSSSGQPLKMETTDSKATPTSTYTNTHSRASQPRLKEISVHREPSAVPLFASPSASLVKCNATPAPVTAQGSSDNTTNSFGKRKPLVISLHGAKKVCQAQ